MRGNWIYWTVWIQWLGTLETQEHKALADTSTKVLKALNYAVGLLYNCFGEKSKTPCFSSINWLINWITRVISRNCSPFNSPIWPVGKSNGEWQLLWHDWNLLLYQTHFNMNWTQRQPSGVPKLVPLMCFSQFFWPWSSLALEGVSSTPGISHP